MAFVYMEEMLILIPVGETPHFSLSLPDILTKS
jgi:hypothetical protein